MTVPTAPLLNRTVLLAAVVLNPVPAMVIVEAAFDRFALLLVTAGCTVAICTAAPLVMLFGCNDGRQVAGRRFGRERYGQRRRRRGCYRSDGAVIEHDRVVSRSCTETGTGNGDRVRG